MNGRHRFHMPRRQGTRQMSCVVQPEIADVRHDCIPATLHMLENCTSPAVTEASNKNHVQGAVSLEDKQRAVEELGNLNDLSWKWSQESSETPRCDDFVRRKRWLPW